MEFTVIAAILLSTVYVNCQQGIIQNFSAYGPRSNIVEGDDVEFVCQVSNQFNDETDSVSIGNLNSEGVFVHLATEAQSSETSIRWNNNILEFSLLNISRRNAGDYRCDVVRQSVPTDSSKITIDVLHPASDLPACETSLINTALYDGDETTLRCTSDAGNPVVTLTWSYTATVTIVLDPKTRFNVSSNRVVTETNVTLFSTHNGVIFFCLRVNPSFPLNQQMCSIGPFTVQKQRPHTSGPTVLSKTLSMIPSTTSSRTSAPITFPDSTAAVAGVDVSVIAAIVVVSSIVVIVIVIVVVCLVRSGRCESHSKDSRVENVSLETGYNNGKPTPKDHGHDNPATTVQHVQSPNGGQLYAVVQKNTPSEETPSPGDASKVDPEAPVYARPDKSRHSAAGSGDIYANAGDAASESTPNDSDASSMALYANHSYANPNNSSQTSAPSESPPASPGKTKTPSMSQTPELAYADLDLTRPASNATEKRGTVSSDESSIYASVN